MGGALAFLDETKDRTDSSARIPAKHFAYNPIDMECPRQYLSSGCALRGAREDTGNLHRKIGGDSLPLLLRL